MFHIEDMVWPRGDQHPTDAINLVEGCGSCDEECIGLRIVGGVEKGEELRLRREGAPSPEQGPREDTWGYTSARG